MPSRSTRGQWLAAVAAGLAAASLMPPGRAASANVAAAPFTLRATVACLSHKGVAVGRVQVTNRRLRALRDLAQDTSKQAKLRGVVVGIAFQRSAAAAELLFELLQVPKDPLRLERVRNVVLLSPHRASATRSAVLACLRS